jgi:Peptidase family M48
LTQLFHNFLFQDDSIAQSFNCWAGFIVALKWSCSVKGAVKCVLTLSACGLMVKAAQAQPVFATATEEMHYQQVLAVQNIVAHQKRLSSVGFAILRAAAPECKALTKPDLGFMALSKSRLPAENKELVAEAMGLSDEIKVIAIYKNSPAAKAGLLEGDVIMDPQSPAVPKLGESDEQTRSRLPGPMSVTVIRNGVPIVLTIVPEDICSDLLRIDPSNDVNAFAQGRVVVVTRGMMRFASRDRDLALVIGHEIAHNALGHTGREISRIGIDKVLGTLFSEKGARSIDRDAPDFYQTLEFQADTLGLYLLARAGYDARDVPGFWRAMAIEYPSYIRATHSSRHPSTPERFLNLDRVSKEIELKIKNGQPLKPDFAN